MDDLISRKAAIEAQERIMSDYPLDGYEDERLLINALKDLPPAQPELIEKAAYIRGFEQGRTQGMIDTKAEEVAQPNLQPTCNQLATDCISRQEALNIRFSDAINEDGVLYVPLRDFTDGLKSLPSAQPEPTLEQIEEYCHKRCLSIVDNALLHKYAQPATSCSEIPNTSDFVSRKAVREMVATWSYDMAEWEDVELALHDVDELPTAQPEVIHCKDCKHYRTIGAFGVPLHKEEYYCDEEQRELPEWWFCAGARRKENE